MDISLVRLERIKLCAQKDKRTTKLLADFSTGYARGLQGKAWYFCVPKFFYEALDIKFTERMIYNEKRKLWTQGSWFNFSEGDKLYNHAYAYCNNFDGWSASNYSKICLSIESARPSLPHIKNKNNLKDRYPGEINFKIMVKKSITKYWEIQRYECLSQDEFIKLLIKGPPEEWEIF